MILDSWEDLSPVVLRRAYSNLRYGQHVYAFEKLFTLHWCNAIEADVQQAPLQLFHLFCGMQTGAAAHRAVQNCSLFAGLCLPEGHVACLQVGARDHDVSLPGLLLCSLEPAAYECPLSNKVVFLHHCMNPAFWYPM